MLADFTTEQILGYYGLAPAEPISYSHSFVYRASTHVETLPWNKKLGLTLILVAVGAFIAAYWPIISLEANYQFRTLGDKLRLAPQLTTHSAIRQPAERTQPTTDLSAVASAKVDNLQPKPVPADFNPLVDPTGNEIEPDNSDFALIVPKVGINAAVIPGVDPVNTAGYSEALKKGVAHSKLSYYPDENGTVYLFSHSTNYEWFIDDLNAVFYYLKNLEANDLIVVMYRNDRYTYQIREKKVVSTREISYLVPQTGVRTLILQTCWPPGTVAKRMLIFADLIEVKDYGKFADVKI